MKTSRMIERIKEELSLFYGEKFCLFDKRLCKLNIPLNNTSYINYFDSVEKYIYRYILENEIIIQKFNIDHKWHFGIDKLGKFYFIKFCDIEKEIYENVDIIGSLDMSEEHIKNINDGIEKIQYDEINLLNKIWSEITESIEVIDILNGVKDWVEHVETIYFYIDNRIYKRSDLGNNLTSKENILKEITERYIDDGYLSISDKKLISFLFCMYKIGKSIKYEEFNGRNIDMILLNQWILDKYKILMSLTNSNNFKSNTLMIINEINMLYPLIDMKYLRYRFIDGLRFNKREVILESNIDLNVTTNPIQFEVLIGKFLRKQIGHYKIENIGKFYNQVSHLRCALKK